MIITCEACDTSFNLDEKMLKPEGSKVRCSVCSKVFTAYPKQVPPPESAKGIETPEPESVSPETIVEKDVEDGSSIKEEAFTEHIDSFEDEDLSQEIDTDFSLEAELDPEEFELEIEETVGEAEGEESESILNGLDSELDLFLDPDIPDESDATILADLDDDDLDFSLDVEADEEEMSFSALENDDLDLDIPFVSSDDQEDMKTMIVDLDDDERGIEDDLDLSDLENILQEDVEADDNSATMVVDGEEAELSFDLNEDLTVSKDKSETSSGDSYEELELDLELDDSVDNSETDTDDAIDLSEIEKMLEEPGESVSESGTVPEQDLDLDVEAGLDSEKWMTDSDDSDMLVQDEEIDLTELEQALEDVNLDEDQHPTVEPELDLDIHDSEDEASEDVLPKIDDDMELDLSDFEDTFQPGSDGAHESTETGEMELDFELDTSGRTEQTLEDEALAETIAVADLEPEVPDVPPPTVPVEESVAPPAPKAVKKGTNKALVFLLIIILLGGGGYGAYYFMNQNGIEIPFLSDHLKPKVNDPGNLKLSTSDINSKFVDNATAGKLFVISGNVKNGYSDNRGMITLEGKLFSTGKVQVNQERVYCGNIMSDLELGNLELDKIKARLSNRLGDNRSNVKIEPGKSIPFMVVFFELPDNLEEFTIEVTGSTVLK